MTRPLFKHLPDWQIATLEEDPTGEVIIEIGSGGTPPTQNAEFWGGTIPWLTPKEITEDNSYRYVFSTERTITENGLEKAGRLWPTGTVMLTKRAPVGYVTINKTPMATNQGFLNFRCGKKLHPEFLYYWLLANTAYLDAVANGSTYPELYPSDLFEFEISLPPLSEQRAIAHILGTLDDKIELNRQMNKTLGGMAQALFKSWFVDFEPFRDQGMEDSSLGPIPKGWAAGRLENIACFVKGVSYRSDDLQESDGALVTLKSVARGGGYQQEGLKSYIGEYKPEHQLQSGEVVVAHTDLTQAAEVLGRAARVQTHPHFQTLVASLDLVIVRPMGQAASNEFLYGLLSRSEFQEHAYGYANGTTVLHLSPKALPEYQCVLPPPIVIEEFTKLVHPVYEYIDHNEVQSHTVATTRDTLSPKLLSGEIRVKDAEKFVEEKI